MPERRTTPADYAKWVVKRASAVQRADKALGKKPDFKDLDDKGRAQLRKDLASARAVLVAWLGGL